MLNVFYNLKELLKHIARFTKNTKFKQIYLNFINQYTVKQLTKLFKIFVKLLVKLQGEVYTTLLKALLYIYKIYNDLKDYICYSCEKIERDLSLVSYIFYLLNIFIITNIL